jgi:lysophospholipase L1-like esterase
VAAELDVAVLDDRSCAGADIDDLFDGQDVLEGPHPPQVDALGPDTTVVTVGVGGNDIDFLDLVEACVLVATETTDPCVDTVAPEQIQDLLLALDALGPSLDRLLQEVIVQAPSAAVYVVGYPTLFPTQGTCAPFTALDVAWFRNVGRVLNATLATSAADAGVGFIDTAGPTDGAGICAPVEDRLIEGVIPARALVPLHPNAAGARRLAEIVTDRLRADGLTR